MTVIQPIRSLLALVALTVSIALPSGGHAAFVTRAEAAFVMDVTTGTVLLNKQGDVPLPPASMSKLMTLNMLFEALADGRVTLDTQFRVSSTAKSMGGSTMFLDETDRPTVEELIKGIIVLSGNDACVVVAEGLAGTEEAFARLMNDRARDLGMTASVFANSSGWPDPVHRMSMSDLGKLAARLINEFPEYYGYFALSEFPYDGRAPQNRFNRNPLLGLGIGADGLKTGHTQEAGYGLVGSARQGNRRIVFAITGLATAEARAQESESIVNWAFRQFVERTVAEEGKVLAEADVWMGAEPTVGLVAPEDYILLVPALIRGAVPAEIVWRGPLQAPVVAGQHIADLIVRFDDLPEKVLPLVAERDVARGGFSTRLRTAAGVLMNRYLGDGADPS